MTTMAAEVATNINFVVMATTIYTAISRIDHLLNAQVTSFPASERQFAECSSHILCHNAAKSI